MTAAIKYGLTDLRGKKAVFTVTATTIVTIGYIFYVCIGNICCRRATTRGNRGGTLRSAHYVRWEQLYLRYLRHHHCHLKSKNYYFSGDKQHRLCCCWQCTAWGSHKGESCRRPWHYNDSRGRLGRYRGFDQGPAVTFRSTSTGCRLIYRLNYIN